MVTEYPFEISAVKREKAVLGITANFCLAKAQGDRAEDPGGTPLAIYGSGSKISFAGIESDGSVSANININSLEGIFRATDYAYQKHMEQLYGANLVTEGEKLSAAYTVPIASGTLKGKTPAQVLLEDPEHGKDALNRQYKWLQDNLAKYPRNKEQMDAIADAAALLQAGKLTEQNVAKKNIALPVPIYNSGPRPNRYKKRDDGMCFTHITQVKWEPGEKYPVVVTIHNFFAPYVEQENGSLNSMVSKRDENSLITFNLRMSDEEWLNVIRSIQAAMHQFETLYSKKCIEDAFSADDLNRQKAGLNPRKR